MKPATARILPPPEREHLQLGYMRLSDSAPLLIAQELGLYQKYGLRVTLRREMSWANIRDKIIVGTLDAAQMLAPLPLVTTLGGTGIRAPILTGLVLSLNGNGITVSPSLWERMVLASHTPLLLGDALTSAKALREVLALANGGQMLTLATVHFFSTHTILLRMWLRAGGIDPDRDLRIIVLPPEQMVDSLAQGVIDGYCVGEPWNTIAVEYGVGLLVTSGFRVWNNSPEKILGVLESWHRRHPATHLRLRLALMEAGRWLADMENRENVIAMLAKPGYLDLPARYLRPSLTGQIAHDRHNDPRQQAEFHVFARYNAGFPWRSHAEFILQQCGTLLGKAPDQGKLASLSQQCFRTDLYREAARVLGTPAPRSDHKPEGVHEQPWQFDDGIEVGSDMMLLAGDVDRRNG